MDNLYGLGWGVGDPFSKCLGCNSREEKVVYHSGGAVGASSILLIQFPPSSQEGCAVPSLNMSQPQGVVVAMITNLQDIALSPTAKKLIREFAWMMTES